MAGVIAAAAAGFKAALIRLISMWRRSTRGVFRYQVADECSVNQAAPGSAEHLGQQPSLEIPLDYRTSQTTLNVAFHSYDCGRWPWSSRTHAGVPEVA